MIGTAAGNGVPLKLSATLAEACGALLVLAKPGIVVAVSLTGFTGMVVAGRGLPEAVTGMACLISLLLMAAGSAIINNVLDRDMDRKMARLTARSAALQQLGAGPAVAAAIVLLGSAAAVASSFLNWRATLLLVAAALSYTLYYTLFLKRQTPWAALLGGLPGALPILIGQASVTAQPDAGSLTLLLIMLIWQPPHFWLLSLSHKEDYRAAGVPILPLAKGDRYTRVCIYLGVCALAPMSLLLGFGGPCSGAATSCAVVLGGFYLLACRYFLAARLNYRAAFRASILYLLLLFSVIVADLWW